MVTLGSLLTPGIESLCLETAARARVLSPSSKSFQGKIRPRVLYDPREKIVSIVNPDFDRALPLQGTIDRYEAIFSLAALAAAFYVTYKHLQRTCASLTRHPATDFYFIQILTADLE